ncbi:unnamed protein product, partial [marine sediment metagenome]
MINKILLPLDCSDVAEEVFPYGEELARKLGCDVILFNACVPEYRLARNMRRLYLKKTAELMQNRLRKYRLKGTGPRVLSEFVHDEFAKGICKYVAANDINLVIMAAHGFTSIRVRPVGSIVDKIFRLLKCPALLVRTDGAHRTSEKKRLFGQILLPLDGSGNSEKALPIVQELALKLKADVNLFRMAQKASEQEGAENYLIGIEEKLRQQGIGATSNVTLGDDQARAITEAGQKAE